MEDNKVSKNKVMKSLFWVYLENISSQLVSFIVTIVLARLLSPEDYGSIAIVAVFINLAGVFVNSGFASSLIQKKDADSLDYNSMFWANGLLAVFLYLLLFIFAPYIADYYNSEVLSPVLRVLALRVPLSAFNSIQTAYVSNHMVFRKSFISTSIGAALSGALGILFAYKDFGLWALVIQSLSNIVFNTILLTFIVEWRPGFEFSMERFKRLFGFGWKILITSLMFTAYSELRTLVIGKRYSAKNLGYYNKGSQFPQLIAQNIDTTINRVMFPTFSKSQDNLPELARMTRRSAKTSAYIMTPILFGLAVVANTLVSILLTDKWLPCVPFLQIMCISWWLQPTQSCSIQAIKAIGRSDIYLRIEIINKIVGISLLIGAIVIFDTPFAIAISMLIGQIIAMIIYGFHVQKYIGYKFMTQLMDVLIPGLLGAVMGLAVYCIGGLIYNKIISLMIQVIIGIIVYYLLSKIFKIEEFNYLMSMIKNRKRG